MNPSNPMKKNIKKIVYVMFENRSFDTMLGWLYNGDSQPNVNNIPTLPEPKPDQKPIPTFQGLTTELQQEYAQPIKYELEFWKDGKKPIVRGVQGNWFPENTPLVDPEEKFKNISYQIYQNCDATGSATMLGFLQNYYDHVGGDIGVEHEILDTYEPSELPILNTLASSYGVSDEWFCSIPSQTSINRSFSLCGNSVGFQTKADKTANPPIKTAMVNNHFWNDEFLPAEFSEKTIWEVLCDNGYGSAADWQIYYSAPYLHGHLGYKQCYSYYLFESLQKVLDQPSDSTPSKTRMDTNYHTIDQFYKDAASGNLPKFSYIEPKFTTDVIGDVGLNGNDYHPPGDVNKGECFLKELYQAVANSPDWEETLFIVAWDEHGGTLDHVAPPTTAINPGITENHECGFKFDRFGVRVPMLFISPWVTQNTVIRSDDDTIPFDHTSWLATLLDWFADDLDPSMLGARTKAAPKFDKVISDTKRSSNDVLKDIQCGQLRRGSKAEETPLNIRKAAEVAKVIASHEPGVDALKLLSDSLADSKTDKQLADFYQNRKNSR